MMKKIQTWDRASGGEIVLMEKLHTEGWWGGVSFSWMSVTPSEVDTVLRVGKDTWVCCGHGGGGFCFARVGTTVV